MSPHDLWYGIHMEIPRLEYPLPGCVICGKTTELDEHTYVCSRCELSWDTTTLEFVGSTNEHRCLTVDAQWKCARCVRVIGHRGEHMYGGE